MNKRIFIVICSIIMTVSAVSWSFAKEGTIIFADSKLDKQELETSNPDSLQDRRPENKNLQVSGESKKDLTYTGKRSLLNQQYNYITEDINALLKEGYTLADILKADEIGNQLEIDPKEMLKEKKKSQKAWDQLKREKMDLKIQKRLEKFKAKNPNAFNEAAKLELSLEEQAIVLAVYEKKPKMTINEIVSKKKDKKVLGDLLKNKKEKSTVPKEKIKNLELTEADIEGISEETLAWLESVSKETKKPLKTLIKQYTKYNEKFEGGKSVE